MNIVNVVPVVNVIMKFGGTSVADADAVTRVLAIVRRQLDGSPKDKPPVVVVSAMSKVTDRLIETERLAREGQADAAAALLGELLERHLQVAAGLVTGEPLGALSSLLRDEFSRLTNEVRAMAAACDVSPRAHAPVSARRPGTAAPAGHVLRVVAPAGMPVPEIGCPTIIPVRLDTDVMVALPLVRTPVGLTTLEAVPLADMVMVVPLAAVIVVGGVVGMPVPVIGCPTNTPLKLDTFVMTALPEVTMPVGLAVTETVAFCEIVMVLVPTTVM